MFKKKRISKTYEQELIFTLVDKAESVQQVRDALSLFYDVVSDDMVDILKAHANIKPLGECQRYFSKSEEILELVFGKDLDDGENYLHFLNLKTDLPLKVVLLKMRENPIFDKNGDLKICATI